MHDNIASQDGWTAIHYAMLGGHKEFEQLLMIHNHHRTESTFDYDLSKQMLEAFTGSKTWVKVMPEYLLSLHCQMVQP